MQNQPFQLGCDLYQLNSTNSTQLNSTQLNLTQLTQTHHTHHEKTNRTKQKANRKKHKVFFSAFTFCERTQNRRALLFRSLSLFLYVSLSLLLVRAIHHTNTTQYYTPLLTTR